MRVGKINDAQLKLAMAAADAGKRRTGDVLVEMGLLKETEQLYYVGQQVKSIIYSLFGWEDGTYQLSFKQSARKERIKLDVHPANLIMRGVKKLYKPERLKRLLLPEDRLIPSLQPAYALQRARAGALGGRADARCRRHPHHDRAGADGWAARAPGDRVPLQPGGPHHPRAARLT